MNRLQKNWLATIVALVTLAKLSEARKNSNVYVWVEDDNDACSHDVQCQEGKWGYHSRCNQKTARCECHDQDFFSRETVRSKVGICVTKMVVGDPCNTNKECESIPGETYCKYVHYDSSSVSKGHVYKGACECKETSIWHNPSGKCLLKATNHGDPCEVSDQCRANLGPDVKCGTTEEYSDKTVCHCPQGTDCGIIVCGTGRFSSLEIIAGIAIIVLVAVCFIIYFCCRVCIRAKSQNKKGPGIRTEECATSASNGEALHAVCPVVAFTNSDNVRNRPVQENAYAAEPLLQTQHPVQQIKVGSLPKSGPQPQHDLKNFEFHSLYPNLPSDTEFSSIP